MEGLTLAGLKEKSTLKHIKYSYHEYFVMCLLILELIC